MLSNSPGFSFPRQKDGIQAHGKEMEIWAMVAWSIWNARNQFYFEKKQSQLGDVLHGATTLLQDYQRLTRHLVGP